VLLWGEFYPTSYVLQGATEADAWSNLAVVAGSSELLRSDLPRPSFARWVRVVIQGSGDLRLWEFQVFEDTETPVTSASTTASTTSTSTVATVATTEVGTTLSGVVTTQPETTVVTSTVGPSTTPFYGPNLAFQKPVLSSSFRSATEHAYKAVDGDVESQWASVSLNDQWLWVDLLGLYAVNRVVLLFGDVPQQFVLQSAPDGIKWSDLATVNGASGFVSTEFQPAVLTQWLRVVCQTSCSIRELTIHGDVPGATTATTATTSSPLTTTAAVSTTQEVTGTSTEGTTSTTGPVNRVNLAELKPVLASSQRLATEHVSRMVDASLSTQWASATGDVAPWAWVDLLGVYNVVEVATHWAEDVGDYEVQTSRNAVEWTTVAHGAGLSGQSVRTIFPENTAATQWIRIVCLSFASTCAIKELHVYDVAGPTGPGTTATTAASTTAPSSTAVPGENVALNKPVLASSSVLPNEYASRAVDGVASTQWSSGAGDQWIWVDLLGKYTLNHVVLMWGSQLPNSFNLETSFNAVDWDSAVLQQLPTAGAQQVALGGTAQWLRVYCTGGCSIQELQVYGTPVNRRLEQEVSAPILV